MLNAMRSDSAFQSLAIVGGDLVTDGNTESYWDTEFFNPAYSHLRTFVADIPYQSCMGNHEGMGVLFSKYFPYPFVASHYWSFDYGPAHFAVLDQYTSYTPGSAQLNWLTNDLSASSKPWKFILLHEPGWSAGGDHENNTTVQNYIQPLCVQYGVPIVLGGHNHYYARAVVNGIEHITTGGGGAPLYVPNRSYPNIVVTSQTHNFCKIEIDGDHLHFTAVSLAGAVIDSFTLSRQESSVGGQAGFTADQFELSPAYPNPFNTVTLIRFSLTAAGPVELKVYDAAGREVETLAAGLMERGRHTVRFDGSDLASGVYFCRLTAGGQSQTRKMVLLK